MEIADGKTGRKPRCRWPEIVRVPVPGGSFFYLVRVPRRSDLRDAFRLAARCAPTVLTTLFAPPDAGVHAFVPRVFPLRRTAAALCAILPLTRLPPQKLAVGVLDPDGALCGAIGALLPLAADVRIVTRQPEIFSADVAFARRRFGATLTAGEDAALLARCDAVVCPAPDTAFRDVPVVLSCEAADGAFSLLPVRLPESLARLCPQSVPPDLFAAALAEKCGVRLPESSVCTRAPDGTQPLGAQQAAALWRAAILRARTEEKKFS